MLRRTNCIRSFGLWSLCLGVLLAAKTTRAADPATTAPAIADNGADSPKALVESMVALLAKNPTTKDWLAFQPPENRDMGKTELALAQQMGAKATDVTALVLAKIGKTEARMISVMQKGVSSGWQLTLEGQLPLLATNGKIDWTKAKIIEKGDKAELTGNGVSILLEKANGKWYLGDGDDHDTLPKDIDGLKKSTTISLKILDQVDQEVKSGALTKANFMTEYPRITNDAFAEGYK